VNKKHWWLYVLKLQNEKWYVGITSKTPEERYREHILKKGAYWTMKYKPLEIELVEDLGIVSKEHAENYENEISRSLMKERGLNNVRGGDLRDTVDYVKRFGYFVEKESWRAFLRVVFIVVLLLALYIDKFVFVFIPGGVR